MDKSLSAFRCRAVTWCDKAPAEEQCLIDPAIQMMRDAIVQLYKTGRGILTKELYCQAYEAIRESNAAPRPFSGTGGPLPKFKGGACPSVQWPLSSELNDEQFWPQNGYPQNPKWHPEWRDFFGNRFTNIFVYTGS